jgi:hypothetical protein
MAKMILSENAIFVVQIFPTKKASGDLVYQAMIEVSRGTAGPGSVMSDGFPTAAEALAWVKERLTTSGNTFEQIEQCQ